MNGIYLHSHLVLKTALGKRKGEKVGGTTAKTTNSTNTTNLTPIMTTTVAKYSHGGIYCVYGHMKSRKIFWSYQRSVYIQVMKELHIFEL